MLLLSVLGRFQSLAQLQADFLVNKTGGCSPLSINFTNKTIGASASATYTWDLGNGNNSSEINPAAVYREEKTYTVKLTVTDGTKSSTKSQTITVYKKPTVDFINSLEKGCAPLDVTYTAQAIAGDGNISHYFWDFGDGFTKDLNDNLAIHTYTDPRTPHVILTVTNSYGCQSTKEKENIVTVFHSLISSFQANKTYLCSLSDTASFVNNSNGPGILSYHWDFGDGSSSTDQNPFHQFQAINIYSIKLDVTSSEGCTASSFKNAYLNVADYKSNIDIQQPVCQLTDLQFVNKSTPTPKQTLWDFGDSFSYNTFSGSNIFHNYYRAGSYTLKLVNDFGDCKDIFTKTIDVLESPALKGFVVDITNDCGSPVKVNFKDTTATAVKWKWNFYGIYDFQPTTQNTSYTFLYDNSYYTTLTVTNSTGCSASINKQVDIRRPYLKIESPNTAPSGEIRSCGPQPINFTTTTNETVTSYNWDFGDGGTSTQASPVHTYQTAGDYRVRLTYTTDKGCTETEEFNGNIVVRNKVKANFKVSDSVVCGNTPILFTNASGPTVYYYWDLGEGVQTSTSQNQTFYHQYDHEGLYTITLIATDWVCADTLIKKDFIKVNPPFPKISYFTKTCEGTRGQVTFSQASILANSWTWDFGDGATLSLNQDQPQVQHTYAKTGVYKVVLSTTNGQCTVRDSTYGNVLLKQHPVLSADKLTICPQDIINISITNLEQSPNYFGDGYNGFFPYYGDGNSALSDGNYAIFGDTVITQTKWNLMPGEQGLWVIVYSNGYKCIDTSNTIPLKVKGPIPGFTFNNGPLCNNGNMVYLQDTSHIQNGVLLQSWEWNFGDGPVVRSTTGSIHHNYYFPGTYNVSMKVTDKDGCTSFYSSSVSTQSNMLKADFTASATTISPGTSISFINTSVTDDTNHSIYKWSFGDGTPTTTSFQTNKTYTNPGTFTVTLIVTNTVKGCSDTVSKVITVKYINAAFSTNTSFINGSHCPPVLVQFNNTSANTSKIIWDFGDSTVVENQFAPSHLYTKSGTFIITLHAFSDNGSEYITKDSVVIKSISAILLSDKFMGCTAQSITFNAPGKLSPSYTWDFGDGVVKQTKDSLATHGFSYAGVYAPSLLVTDAEGCTMAATLLTKIVIDSLQINIGNIPLACNSSQVYFQPVVNSVAADQAQQVLHYLWNFGTGNITDTSNLKLPSFTYTKPGTYLVYFLVESPAGCKKETTKQVVVDEKIKGVIIGPGDICEKSSALFTATAASSNVSWAWDFGQGSTSNQQNPTAQLFTNPGNFPVTLMVKNGACIDTTFHSLNVHANPKLDLNQSQLVLCLGNSIQLSASGADLYNWQPKSGLNDNTIANPVASPATTTTYTLDAISVFGCKSTDSVKIIVGQPIHLEVSKDTFVCKGSGVQLNASGAYTYQWINFTIGLNNTAIPNPVASPGMTSTYTVQGADQYNCFTDKANINVTVTSLPTVNAGQDVILSGGTSYQFQPVYSNDVIKWNWSPGDYLSCTNCASPVTSPIRDISYIITVRNVYNCTASDTVKIATECGQSHIYIPDAFTPNDDGVNSTFSIKGSGVKLVRSFGIYNRWGELIFVKKNFLLNDASAAWDGKYRGLTVPVGSYVYIAEFQCQSGEMFTKKGTVTVVY